MLFLYMQGVIFIFHYWITQIFYVLVPWVLFSSWIRCSWEFFDKQSIHVCKALSHLTRNVKLSNIICVFFKSVCSLNDLTNIHINKLLSLVWSTYLYSYSWWCLKLLLLLLPKYQNHRAKLSITLILSPISFSIEADYSPVPRNLRTTRLSF